MLRRSSPASGKTDAPAGRREGFGRALGLGLITGAADDDPSAIGTYASAGAKIGNPILWMAPATMPMMFAVVYLTAKLSMVSGRGLFDAIRHFYPRWLLYPLLSGALIANTVEAGADLGGMAAALGIYLPFDPRWLVPPIAAVILALQILGSYVAIRNVFRWLALALLAYVGAAILARPDWPEVLRATVVPTIRLDREFMTLVVAIIGTTLSAYLYSWQSNEEVEEEIALGRTTVQQRKGASRAELHESRRDIWIGMIFSNIVMYFIILSTAATLHQAGQTEIASAADAADALRPLAGDAAGALFVLGVVGVGFLAVPVMTTGAAYDVAQTLGWKASLHARPREAKGFYGLIILFTALGVGVNFLGFDPMDALVWAGVVQGFTTPALLALILLMTNSRRIMGERINGIALNLLGGLTLLVSTGAGLTLLYLWLI
ncbi:NRAMP family divalent metal transporter [Rhizorhabdus histidinilytica]|uniref:NRAMP family divalent metal transporter n=1 Tax=Rhizorhabdus histidinilytica TaxID=439228 RepID=UPI00322073C1